MICECPNCKPEKKEWLCHCGTANYLGSGCRACGAWLPKTSLKKCSHPKVWTKCHDCNEEFGALKPLPEKKDCGVPMRNCDDCPEHQTCRHYCWNKPHLSKPSPETTALFQEVDKGMRVAAHMPPSSLSHTLDACPDTHACFYHEPIKPKPDAVEEKIQSMARRYLGRAAGDLVIPELRELVHIARQTEEKP